VKTLHFQALARFFELLAERVLYSPPSSNLSELIDKVFTNFIKIFTSCSHVATLEVVGRHFGGFVASLTRKRAEYINIPGKLHFLFNWEMTVSTIIAMTVKNESASRFRSVRGFSVFISEILANDEDEHQVNLSVLKTVDY
jgi:hypothetical protein